MTDKLEQLTKQIYDEGIAKAQNEAGQIISAAEEEKKKMLRAARQESEDIISLARKEAEELKKRVESEMRMASQQSLALLRQKITELICVKVGQGSSSGMFNDPDFLKRMLEIVMETWAQGGCQEKDLYVRLPADLQENVKNYFLEKAKELLGQSVRVEFDEKIKGGFVVAPSDGSYRLGFTEEDFNALIQYFLRPRMKKFLFGEESL